MKINLLERDCPICENNEISNIPEINPDLDPQFNEKIIENYWSGFFKEKVFFPYYRCNYWFCLIKVSDQNSLVLFKSK